MAASYAAAGSDTFRDIICRAASVKPPLVSSPFLRRLDGFGSSSRCVSAFIALLNSRFNVSTKRRTFWPVVGLWLSPRSFQVARLSSFSPASLALSLSFFLKFLIALLATLSVLGGVACEVDGVVSLGLAPIGGFPAFSDLRGGKLRR